MKKLFITLVVLMGMASVASAQYSSFNIGGDSRTISTTISVGTTYQGAYIRSNGTFVQGHFKTMQNNTNIDNFSTKGNSNLFTGTVGSVARDYSAGALNYGSDKTIYTGPKGGQYYINSNGNKTYVPKRTNTNVFGW